MAKQKKHDAAYPGLLGKPKPYTALQLDPDNPPWWFDRTLDEWRRRVVDARLIEKKHRLDCLKALYRHFDIDMRTEGAEFKLAMALAQRHVPAFQIVVDKKPRGRSTKLKAIDTMRFLDEVDRQAKLMQRKYGKQPSVRQLAKEVGRSPFCRSKHLSAETVRDLLHQLRNAKSAFMAGKTTEFQRQYYEELMPLCFPGLPTGKLGI